MPLAFDEYDDPTVPGWFNFSQVYAWMVDAAPDPAVFVEVGAWLGRSTAYLARRVQASGKRIQLYVVDSWTGSPGEFWHEKEVARYGGELFAVFCANMTRLGVLDLLHPIRAPSVQAADEFADESADFVYIDAAHDYESVAADLRAWWPKVKVGGWIAGHDYPTWEGVQQAVDEFFGRVSLFPSATSWIVRKLTGRNLPS